MIMFRELEKETFMNMLTLDSMTLEGFSHYD
jgi:hypothetical protein